MPEVTKFRGVPVYFNGQEYIIPPLSVRQFRDSLELLTEPVGEVNSYNVRERMMRFVPVIGMALRRNYPEITDDNLLDWLDLNTFATVAVAVRTASGMKAAKPGEAPPVAASTGPGSTAV